MPRKPIGKFERARFREEAREWYFSHRLSLGISHPYHSFDQFYKEVNKLLVSGYTRQHAYHVAYEIWHPRTRAERSADHWEKKTS